MTLLILIIGSVLIYFIQTQKIFEYLAIFKFLKEIRACKICSGFYVYFLLELLFRNNFLSDLVSQDSVTFLIISLIGAIILSLLNYYVSEGISKNHQTIVING